MLWTMPEHKPNDDAGNAAADDAVAEQKSSQSVSTPTRIGEKALVISPIPGLILAALAALLAWGVLGIVDPVFELPDHLRDLSGNAPEEQQNELMAASVDTNNNNATFGLVLLASTLGLFLTVAELTFRRERLRAIWGGLLAILIAGAIAVGGGCLGAFLSLSPLLPDDALTRTMIVQGVTWGVVGLGVGLAVGLPILRVPLMMTCAVSGMLGGLFAGLIFPITASVLLPNLRTQILMPDPGIGRLLWLGLASGLIALTLTGMGKKEKAGA
jgi:hypothetical protein